MKRAFTLIELLVVIAIIAILAAILFPVFAQAKESAKNAALLNNTKEQGTASVMYSTDYDDMFPVTMASHPVYAIDDGYQILIQPYLKNMDIIRNPKREPFNNGYLTRDEHFGMPGRAITSRFAANRTTGYYTGTHDGQLIRYDGIGGFVNLEPAADGGGDWLGRYIGPSYTNTAIEDVSGTMMCAEANFWDQGMPRLDTADPAEGWCLGSDALGGWGIEGVTCTTKPNGGGSGVTGNCWWQDGRSTVVMCDTSAKSLDWRSNFYAPTRSKTTAFWVIKYMNPLGW